MPLSVLYCDSNGISSLEPLKDSALVMLNCGGNDIEDLEPLHGQPLNILHCGQNKIKSFEPLRDSMLNMLTCVGNKVDSLAPLEGMPLGVLTCGENCLTTLGSFLKKPPEDFLFDCPTLPTEELIRAREAWDGREIYAHLVRNIDVLLALRKKDEEKLFDQALAFRGHHYLFIPKFLRWIEAENFCEDLGGHLVTITSEEKNKFLCSMFQTGCWAWIGLTISEQGGEWITGEPYVYSNFMEPLHERRIGHKIFARRWVSDDIPGSRNTFIIEWDE